jgi:hypothetical protein
MNGTICLKEDANLNRSMGTAEQLMRVARRGVLPKYVLVSLLDVEYRPAFLDACAVIEKKYTEDCTATNDPCLESGCALEGEICLEPLMRAGIEYHKACAAEWITLFADPRKRIEVWKH